MKAAFQLAAAIAIFGANSGHLAQAHEACKAPGCAGTPYSNMAEFAPIGARMDKSMDIPASAKGPAVDPTKGYRVQRLRID